MKKLFIWTTIILCTTTLAFAAKPDLDMGERKITVRADATTGVATFQLTATASDPDGGTIDKYEWYQGPSGRLSTESSPTFSNKPGEYRYTAKVTDSQNETMARGIIVTVIGSDDPTAAAAPVKKPPATSKTGGNGVDLDMGNRKITVRADATTGVATFQLTATASDPDGGTIDKYEWYQGPSGRLSTEASPTFSNKPGEYRYTVKVTDDQGEFIARGVSVTVVGADDPESTSAMSVKKKPSPSGSQVVVAPTRDLELWMADPEVRLSQYVYVQLAANAKILTATLDGELIFEAGDVKKGEVILELDHLPLKPGEHTLTVTAGDDEVSKVWKKVRKAGVPPQVGIDKHNAICRNGEPFFPVTSWGLSETVTGNPHKGSYSEWAGKTINSTHGVDWNKKLLSDWGNTLDLCAKNNIPMMGPANGQYYPGTDSPKHIAKSEVDGKWHGHTSLDTNKMASYIEIGKNHPGLLAWSWKDEPGLELGQKGDFFLPTEVRRWTEFTHQMDPEHPTMINIVGYNFTCGGSLESPVYRNHRAKAYSYLFSNEKPQGTGFPADYNPSGRDKFLIADILSFDYYPYERGTVWDWCNLEDCMLAFDRLQEWNHNLMPAMNWIETGDIWKDTVKDFAWKNIANNPAITPHQFKNLIWLSVIHGAKGICWFHYFGDPAIPGSAFPAENKAVAEQFIQEINELTPVVLGSPKISRTVSCHVEEGGRVDFMARESDDGSVFVFAGNIKDQIETVRFSVEGARDGTQVEVYGENRTLSISDDSFVDTFAPLDIHIYIWRSKNER